MSRPINYLRNGRLDTLEALPLQVLTLFHPFEGFSRIFGEPGLRRSRGQRLEELSRFVAVDPFEDLYGPNQLEKLRRHQGSSQPGE